MTERTFEFGGITFRPDEVAALGENGGRVVPDDSWLLPKGTPATSRDYVSAPAGEARKLVPLLPGAVHVAMGSFGEAWIAGDEYAGSTRSETGVPGSERLALPSGGYLVIAGEA